MASLTDKLFAIGQNIGPQQERFQLSRQGSYRPTGGGARQIRGDDSGSRNPLAALGGAALGALQRPEDNTVESPVPSFSVEGAREASERGASSIAEGMGASMGVLPSAEQLGFGKQPKAGILSQLLGG